MTSIPDMRWRHGKWTKKDETDSSIVIVSKNDPRIEDGEENTKMRGKGREEGVTPERAFLTLSIPFPFINEFHRHLMHQPV